jgi:hypothetical protein
MPPIRKPDKIIENRQSLGSWERKFEQDKQLVEAGRLGVDLAVGLMSMIGNLGIGGALLLASIFWMKDIEEIVEFIKDLWPESGAFLSPEWIAKFGEDPIPATENESTKNNNHWVNEIPPNPDGNSLQGKSPYEAYTIGASGRQANYDFNESRIIENWLASATPKQREKYNAKTQQAEAQIRTEWYKQNSPPPGFLLLNEFAHQINIRYTCAKREFALKGLPPLARIALTQSGIQNTDPTKESDYQMDPMLDFATLATYPNSMIWTSSDRNKAQRGSELIALFAFWQPPTSSPP